MNKAVKELYKRVFTMDADDWISSSDHDDKIVIRLMYRSDEGHGSRTRCYADFELRVNGEHANW